MARQEVTVAQRIITVSEFSRSRIESVFPRARGSVDVIPNGPGLSPLTVEEPLEAAVLSPFALFVGGIQRNKNLGRLIAAFRDLHDDSLQLVIAGPPSNDVRRTERMLRGGDNIRWIGQPTDGQLAWLYRHAEMLVLPTLYEGFGLPFLEAMAAGTPVLGPSSGAAAEVIGGAGYLVDPLEVAAIRDGIRRLRQDPVLRLTLIEAGKVRAQGYSWERAAQATHDVYLDAIRGPMASHPEPRA
jgi:alpha-1,3-rhamnosyl/mannosyltransferase